MTDPKETDEERETRQATIRAVLDLIGPKNDQSPGPKFAFGVLIDVLGFLVANPEDDDIDGTAAWIGREVAAHAHELRARMARMIAAGEAPAIGFKH